MRSKHLLKVLTLELKSNDLKTYSVRSRGRRGDFLEQVSASFVVLIKYLLRLGLSLLGVDVEHSELPLLLLDRGSEAVDFVRGRLGGGFGLDSAAGFLLQFSLKS